MDRYVYGYYWDVDVTKTEGGYWIEVEKSRKAKPMPEYVAKEEHEPGTVGEYLELLQLQVEWYEQNPEAKMIGLPFDGMRMRFLKAEAAHKLCVYLKSLGYRVPHHLLTRLEREADNGTDVVGVCASERDGATEEVAGGS
jgi:hypothetical protein